MRKFYTKEEIDEVVRRYAWDETENIAEDLGRTIYSIRSQARRRGIEKMLPHIRKRYQKEKEFNDINRNNA